ncbi:alpha/beta-hydrolase [Linnemannia elongata AG-77]|uniref:Alpha/beta-hydrolase n=1 Tax=Linnemannia elongata AG-77 TaxID=1314771 RepID=A0A197KAF5_9FUNG|nr:alpha/beta-hydrolase [Linnemannia elongata AG-77]
MASVPKPPCVVCKTPSVTRCSRCKVVHYCSEACQRKDWPTHKIACTPSTVSSSSNAKGTPPTSTSTSTNNKQPTLPNPSKVLNVNEPAPKKSGKPSLQKPAPQKSSTRLKFKYIPSIDNVDENLVIFFHGLGDKIEPNFTKLARSLQLPQTAAVCIQAPTPVPYLEEEGYQWFPSFNNLTGDLLGPEAPERILQVKNLVRPELIKFLKHCVDHCGFNHRQIVLFGFSQGAEIALDLAAFGGMNLRAVISIAGYMMEESANGTAAASPLTTKIMVIQGDKDTTRTVKEARERIKPVQRIFGKGNVEHRIVAGMGHGMPRDEPGWRPLMEFFANNLEHRSVALENMSDVYEVRG